MRQILCLTVAGALVAGAVRAEAQVLQPPPRWSGGLLGGDQQPDPNRVQQSVLFNLSTLGGYDNNLTPEGTTATAETQGAQTGYTGFADAAMNYRRVRQSQAFEAGGRGYVNAFRNIGLSPTYGGDAQVRLTAPIGRRNELTVSQSGRTDPVYALGAFAPLVGDLGRADLPDVNAANGFLERRSWTSDSAVSFVSRWTPRNSLSAAYSYDLRRFEDQVGDGQTHMASVGYTRTVGRRSGVAATARHTFSAYDQQSGVSSSFRDDTVELGVTNEHRFSATRRLSLAVGAGGSLLHSSFDESGRLARQVLPSGYASMRLDLVRTWAISADYRRSVSRLEGLVTQPFATDTALVQLGGQLHARLQAVVSGGYSAGRGADGSGSYDSQVVTAQLRYRMMWGCSAVVADSVSAYRLRDVGTLPAGLPADLHRNAFRVGIDVSVPLYGTFADGSPR